MELTQLQKRIYKNKLDKKFNVTDVGAEIIWIAEELGELARAYKRSNRKPVSEIDNREEMMDAVGDIMVYCFGLCEMFGVDSDDLLGTIVAANENRKYGPNHHEIKNAK
jgi:NTP pyrophosphatase (non-canonical NTP hydrolase)